MNKAEILLELLVIKKECRDIVTYDRLYDLTSKLEKELDAKDKEQIREVLTYGTK